MTVKDEPFQKSITLRTWECCGNRWEMLVYAKYPARYTWEPKCPCTDSNKKI